METNRFHDAESVKQLLRQMVGAGSRCWEDLSCAGAFDSDEAVNVADEGYERLQELLTITIGGRK